MHWFYENHFGRNKKKNHLYRESSGKQCQLNEITSLWKKKCHSLIRNGTNSGFFPFFSHSNDCDSFLGIFCVTFIDMFSIYLFAIFLTNFTLIRIIIGETLAWFNLEGYYANIVSRLSMQIAIILWICKRYKNTKFGFVIDKSSLKNLVKRM